MSKEFKVGILALVSGILLYYGFNFLKGIDFFSKTNKYYVKYSHVDGLTVSNPVIVDGLSVGRVSEIKLDQQNKVIIVELDVSQNVILGDTTRAVLVNSDFLGGKAIKLEIGSITKRLRGGDTLRSSIDAGLADILDRTGTDLGETLTSINGILQGLEGSGERLKSTLEQMEKTLKTVNYVLSTNSKKLGDILSESKTAIQSLNTNLSKLKPILSKTDSFMDSLTQLNLKATLASADSLMNNLNTTISMINQQQGTLGKLIGEDSLYNNLNKLLQDLDNTINHFNEYPKDFLGPLGKKNKKVKKHID